MPHPDHDQFAPEPQASRSYRRRNAVLGVTGLAAVLGVGAFIITDRLTDDSSTRDVTAISAPQPQAVTASASTPANSPTVSASASRSPSPSATAATKEAPDPAVSKEIVAARSKAAADGVPLRRALSAEGNGSVTDVHVTNSGSPQDAGGTLKVVSAHGDLTGYQEMAWVGDKGEVVGDARCTQMFRLSNDEKATKRPTLLVCWRTSAAKSVYTVALSAKSPPSKKASVAAIEKAWAKLS
jgi:hypothetical protein